MFLAFLEALDKDLILGVNPKEVVLLLPPFLISVFFLNHFLLKPMITLFEERDRRTEGARKEAQRLEKKLEANLEHFESHMTQARLKANEERQEIRKEAALEQEEILALARTEVAGTLEEIRGRVSEERASAQSELHSQSQELARELAEKVLGRPLVTGAKGSRKAPGLREGA